MTVAKLIEELQKKQQDLEVIFVVCDQDKGDGEVIFSKYPIMNTIVDRQRGFDNKVETICLLYDKTVFRQNLK